MRWYLDPTRQGRAAYLAGHIPGASFLDLDRDLSGPKEGSGGRHPWPTEEQFGRVLGAAGVSPADTVVAYDDQSGAIAARLWYLLRAHGHERAAVLDGGLAQWTAEGRPLTTDVPRSELCEYTVRLRPGFVVDKAAVAALPSGSLLLDARAGERYRGEVEPIDPRAGHIPGATSAPFAGNLTGGAVPVFLLPAELRARYEAIGSAEREPVVYCGSGITACHDLLALHLAGLRGRLYAGSWSEWSADPDRPVAKGPD